jgi:flotillin
LQRIIEACGGANQAYQLLMLEHLDHIAETASQAISNIKFDKVVVWEGNGKDGASSTAGFLQSMARTLPPMMQVVKDIGGVELPGFFGKMTTDAKPAAPVAPVAADAPVAPAKPAAVVEKKG